MDSTDSHKVSSGGSGYISDSPPKSVICPTCGSHSEMPSGGCNSFPPNYIIQHRMVLATLNHQSTHLLCDLCPSDVTVCNKTTTARWNPWMLIEFCWQATHRCTQCALSLCGRCGEVHLRQKLMNDHEVLSLSEARQKGITRVRRQIMCMRHANVELDSFCADCTQVSGKNDGPK